MLTGTHPCDAPPRQGGGTSERQLMLCWSVCCGARTRSVDYAAVTFCTVFSYTPPRHRHDCGSVDLKRHFAPLVAHHSLTRLFFWFHLTASAVLLIGSVSGSSDLCLNSLLALAAGLLFSCADGCDCNRRAASSTSCNIQYTRFADDTWFI